MNNKSEILTRWKSAIACADPSDRVKWHRAKHAALSDQLIEEWYAWEYHYLTQN